MKYIKKFNESEIHDHRNSGMLNTPYVFTYSNAKSIDQRRVIGYKLVRERGFNFYSLATGMFRYKTGPVDTKNAAYHVLYKDTEQYQEYMIGKVAVFKSIEDLDNFYEGWRENPDNLVVIKFELSGDIIEVTGKMGGNETKMWAGSYIERMTKIR
jgi:hypothetical protein